MYRGTKPFSDKVIVGWELGDRIPPDFGIRIAVSYDEYRETKLKWTDKFSAFLEQPASREIDTFVVGLWGEDRAVDEVLEALVAANDKLPNLRHLFFGEIYEEETFISWIQQTDLSPLFEVYPKLETFYCRGSLGLQLGLPQALNLQRLVLEANSLPQEIVRSIMRAQMPELRHLELWLGSDEYSRDDADNITDFYPLFSGELFPKLEHLGLRNSEIADDLAIALAHSPLLARLKTLDLADGTLGDRGAEALLDSPNFSKLETLEITHNFITAKLIKQLSESGVKIRGGKSYIDSPVLMVHRYVAISE
jgi:hypothetical protein